MKVSNPNISFENGLKTVKTKGGDGYVLSKKALPNTSGEYTIKCFASFKTNCHFGLKSPKDNSDFSVKNKVLVNKSGIYYLGQ